MPRQLTEFLRQHLDHGRLASHETEADLGGYNAVVTCPCGATYESTVTVGDMKRECIRALAGAVDRIHAAGVASSTPQSTVERRSRVAS